MVESTFMFIFASQNIYHGEESETTSLRLYLLNLQSKVLILGNGGLKQTATYQEDEMLNRCVNTLQKIDIELKQREKQKVITIRGTELLGELSFVIDD